MLIKPVWSRLFFEADKDGGGGGGKSDDSDKGGEKDSKTKTDADDKGGKAKGKEFAPISTQEEFEDRLASRLARQETNLRKTLTEEIKAQLKADADAEAATKQGDYKKLYEDLKGKYDELDGKLKTSERSNLVAKIAAKHKLPEDLHARLIGDDEAALDADAAALAKLIGPPKASDTETTKKSTTATTDATKTTTQTQDGKVPAFSFVPPGAVPVPPE